MTRRFPITFRLGLALMLVIEGLLFIDVANSHRGAVETDDAVQAVLADRPATAFAVAARFVAINMTALVWPAYLILLEGVLAMQRPRSPVRARPHHFAILCLASVFIWCVFDAINFNRGMGAWTYIGIPPRFGDRLWGYFLAFACVVPGMLMAGQAMLNAGWYDRLRSRPWRMPAWGLVMMLIIGAAMFLWPIVSANPAANFTLWTSLVLLLDPINLRLGWPSLLRDWQNGWYGRTIALGAGGLLSGLLWEFWNYWALAKWIYHLPFLGWTEQVRYFQMPVIGLLGFIPFGAECWVMWQTIRIVLDGLVEPLPGENDLL